MSEHIRHHHSKPRDTSQSVREISEISSMFSTLSDVLVYTGMIHMTSIQLKENRPNHICTIVDFGCQMKALTCDTLRLIEVRVSGVMEIFPR
jgi:deoxyribose-phosphate aldolase